MTKLNESQYKALIESIYSTLITMPEMGMGEIGDCRTEAERIVDEWMEENNIELI